MAGSPKSLKTAKMASANDADIAYIADFERGLDASQKAAYDKIKGDRKAVRSKVTKAITNVMQTVSDPDQHWSSIEFTLEKLDSVYTELEKADAAMWSRSQLTEFHEADQAVGHQWYANAIKARGMAKAAIEKRKRSEVSEVTPPAPPAPPAAPIVAPEPFVGIKLPKVDLPKFKGESPLEYQNFKAQFDALVHNNARATVIDKLVSLKGACIDEAGKIAEGFAVTEHNYEELYNTLKERYGKPRLILQAHADKILSLENFTAKTIGSFLNNLETALRCMGESKVDADDLAPLLVPFVEKKMPQGILMKWRETIDED